MSLIVNGLVVSEYLFLSQFFTHYFFRFINLLADLRPLPVKVLLPDLD